MVYWIVGDREYGEEEYRELENQRKAQKEAERIARREAEEKAREEGAQLMRQISQAYTAYKEFMGRHPQLSLRVTEGEAADHDLYEKLRQNLGHADEAPRCSHIKTDGVRCGSPRMKSGALCYAHQRMAEARPQALRLPPMEDPNAIQLGLMEVARALIDGQITEKTAGLLFYALQTAAANVDRLTFHEAPEQMVVDGPVMPAEAGERFGDRGQVAFSYEMLDHDLKLKLQEIGDEMDRRLREKRSREKHTNASLAAEDTKEHRGGPEIAGTETRFGVETNADSRRELALREIKDEDIHNGKAVPPKDSEGVTTEDMKEHRGEPEIAGAETGFAAETLCAGMRPQPNY
jgi:hypothetical protein